MPCTRAIAGKPSVAARFRSIRRLALLACLGMTWPTASQAVTIVAVDGPDLSGPPNNPTGLLIGTGQFTGDQQYFAVSWTQSASYADVSVTALLSGNFRGLAHLTSTLGPGATAADQVAVGDFMLDLDSSERAEILLLSGLTLGPGTYFLTLEPSPASSGNWWREQNTTLTLDAGVAFLGMRQAVTPDIDPAFVPASGFAPALQSPDLSVTFAVSGERAPQVPEPASGAILAAALVLLGWIGGRRADRVQV